MIGIQIRRFLSAAFLTLASAVGVHAQTATDGSAAIREATRAIASELRVVAGGCRSGNIVEVGIWPLDPDTLPMPEGNAVALYETIIAELTSAKPDCVRILDAGGVSPILVYLDKSGAFRDLGNAPRAEIEAAFRGADYILALRLFHQGAELQASLKLLDLGGETILAVPAFPVPQTKQACGIGAVGLDTALDRAAKAMLDEVPDIQAVVNAGGYYAATDTSVEFSDYASRLLTDALVKNHADPLTERRLRVAKDGDAADAGTFTLEIRHWLCGPAERLTLTARLTNPDGVAATWSGAVLRTSFPPMQIEPDKPGYWSLSVTPGEVTVNDKLAVVAEVPATCDPQFVDFQPSGVGNPVPQRFFEITPLADGVRRFTSDASTPYGLMVAPEDEKGTHRFGFFCGQSGEGKSREVLRALWLELTAGNERNVDGSGARDFWFQSYDIR